ncbi:MAG: hypothetical protein V4850_34825 [Myxococcota bacterium]
MIRFTSADERSPLAVQERLQRAVLAREDVTDELDAIAATVSASDEPWVARWARDLYARLPRDTRETLPAWAVATAGARRLAVPEPLRPGTGFGDTGMATTKVRVRLHGTRLHVHWPNLTPTGWHELEVAAGAALSLEVEDGEGLERVRHALVLRRGGYAGAAVAHLTVTLRAPSGAAWRLTEGTMAGAPAALPRVYAPPGVVLPEGFERVADPGEADVTVRRALDWVPWVDAPGAALMRPVGGSRLRPDAVDGRGAAARGVVGAGAAHAGSRQRRRARVLPVVGSARGSVPGLDPAPR